MENYVNNGFKGEKMTKEKIELFSKHIIPFDIGITVNKEIKTILEKTLNIFPEIEIDKFWKGISIGLIISKQIDSYIELYIYEYGVGVFVIKDREKFYSSNDYFSYDFCTRRSAIHSEIYLNEHIDCAYLNRVMKNIWNSIDQYNLRKTANEQWELHGISYAMPIDFLKLSKPLNQINDKDKKNIYVILNPSLIEKEDAYSKVAIIEDSKYINFGNFDETEEVNNICVENLEDNYQVNDSISVYTSWSTLLVCFGDNKNIKKIEELFTCLQVELQAFWFYTYILSSIQIDVYSYKNISKLKNLLFDYNEIVEKFYDIEISKLPNYLLKIWKSMIDTGYLEKHIRKTEAMLKFLIEKSDNTIQEKQYKFMKVNNILILSIAYVQVIPFLYSFFVGNYKSVNIVAIILIGVFYIVIALITWKKE